LVFSGAREAASPQSAFTGICTSASAMVMDGESREPAVGLVGGLRYDEGRYR
jgi:hypothetical protein